MVSRRVEGDIHRYTWQDVARRSRQVANGLDGMGLAFSDRMATLAWNGYRHLELYFGVSGSGRVLHTINPRLHPDQVAWIINHAEDRVVMTDLTFVPVLEKIAGQLPSVERYIILSAIDRLWQEHLYNMDSLRTSIGLRAYGQRDPLIEYKAEAFKLFDELMVNIKTEICHNIFRSASSMLAFENFLKTLPAITSHGDSSAYGGAEPPVKGAAQGKASDMVSEAAEAVSKAKPIRTGPKEGRNDPCPCGSGLKFKRCHGKD